MLSRACAVGAIALSLAGGCRREQPAPLSPAATDPAVTAPAAGSPRFDNTPAGAARRFMYAWVAEDEALLLAAMEPDPRYEILYTAPFVGHDEREAVLGRLPTESVREFKPGDEYPMGPPGGQKEMRIVPEGALDENTKLVMIMERGLFVHRKDDQWRVMASDIIDEIHDLQTLANTTTSPDRPYPDPRVIIDPRHLQPPATQPGPR